MSTTRSSGSLLERYTGIRSTVNAIRTRLIDSLTGSSNQVLRARSTSGTTQRLVTISPANNSADDYHPIVIKQRTTSSPPSFTTSVQKGRREQSSYSPCIFATGYNKLPSLNMGDENLTEVEWMLDSGASEHFTGDINDFVEFETLALIAVQTATETTNIIGRGSVILQIKNKVLRIYPVYYIPELTMRLFFAWSVPSSRPSFEWERQANIRTRRRRRVPLLLPSTQERYHLCGPVPLRKKSGLQNRDHPYGQF